MKKRAPPKATKSELMGEASRLLHQKFRHPAEAVEWILTFFNGWDLENMIEILKEE